MVVITFNHDKGGADFEDEGAMVLHAVVFVRDN
jgi:hypothetical protein